MTSKGKMRAARALVHSRCGVSADKYYFPMVYVVDDSPFFFYSAAKRYQRWKEAENEALNRLYDIQVKEYVVEEMTIREAWIIYHGERMPKEEIAHINERIDQTGHGDY